MGNGDSRVPLTYNQAMESTDCEKWKGAMDEEINQLNKKTWKLVPLPPGSKAVKSKWVYTNKTDAQKRITRHRARLVAKGFTQREGIDYNEVFAPVAKYSTVRLMLALVAREDLEMLQIDVKAAFLNGELEEEIYMQQPDGYVSRKHPHYVYQLLKAIYGLKQSSRAWHKTCDEYLRSLGAKKSTADTSLYMLMADGNITYILVYVDDMLLIGRSKDAIQKLAKLVADRFEIRIEPSVTKFLGIIVERKRQEGIIKIHSAPMIEHVTSVFNMDQCRKVSTPLPPGTVLPGIMDKDEKQERMDRTPYRQLVGSLLHLANTTRPDIAYTTSFLSRFLENPGQEHWNAAKYVLRYLTKTRALGIVYRRDGNSGLHGYTDSDFATDRISRKSMSGFVFKLAGGAISWRSKKQDTIAQSTLEAEYIAMSYTVREAVWLRRMLSEIKARTKLKPTVVFGDNQGAMELAYNDVINERTKHIEVKYHFSKEKVQDGTVVFNYIPTQEMTADIMTKNLPAVKHKYLIKKLGMAQDKDLTREMTQRLKAEGECYDI